MFHLFDQLIVSDSLVSWSAYQIMRFNSFIDLSQNIVRRKPRRLLNLVGLCFTKVQVELFVKHDFSGFFYDGLTFLMRVLLCTLTWRSAGWLSGSSYDMTRYHSLVSI